MNFPLASPTSAYVHVPFCAHKCGYCDFASVAGRDDRADRYLDALAAEVTSILQQPTPVRTLYIGGGTPTYLSVEQLDRLLTLLQEWLPLHPAGEFSVESNPNTLDDDKVTCLADHGVTRVSLGAQSFHRPLLAVLEREHEPAAVGQAVDRLRRRIENLSIDLIFGVPGQSLPQWEQDLDALLALEPTHCSTYSLIYEKGTRLWKQRQEGIVRPIDEELERTMYERVIDRLGAADWRHYEISSFARRLSNGAWSECLHHRVYWRNEPYFGFGTGAASYINGVRAINTRELDAYIDRCLTGRSPITSHETLVPEDRARETIILSLRMFEGIERSDFRSRTGYDFDDLVGTIAQRHREQELIDDDGTTIKLSREGLMVADAVLAEYL